MILIVKSCSKNVYVCGTHVAVWDQLAKCIYLCITSVFSTTSPPSGHPSYARI